jgi:hypothetical protein
MQQQSIRCERRRRSERTGALREVDVFAVHEVVGGEPVQLAPQLEIDQHQAARDGRHLAADRAVEPGQPVGVEEAGPPEHRRQRGGVADVPPQAGQRVHRVPVVGPVGMQRAPGVDAVLRMCLGIRDQRADDVTHRRRVGVEQEHIPPDRV